MKCELAPTQSKKELSTARRAEATTSECPMSPPSKIRRDLPLSDRALETVRSSRRAIANILEGRDRERVAVVCGPCSIDDLNSAMIYAERLKRLADEVSDHVVLVMRTYFEKPRSVVGWKGLVYDPMCEGERSATTGIVLARRLLTRINEIGMPCATEFLNPLVVPYLEDAISYGSIGSRTVESQIHREMASRLALPIGMKNGMDGDGKSAVNAVKSASRPHSFFGTNLDGVPCLIETSGNDMSHVILRGGSRGPNYDADSVNSSVEACRSRGLERPVVVDCSHGNSAKDHRRQAEVAREVVRQFQKGQNGIAGLMLESNLVEGRQDVGVGGAKRFGQSITDACIGWKDTESLIRELASGLA